MSDRLIYPNDVLARVEEWPKQITCHRDDWMARHYQPDGLYEWTVLEGDGEWCQFCGSCSPKELMTYLAGGARLERADLKYGWPHKFYVVGKSVPRGQRKWKNVHLLDLDDQTFAEFSEILGRYTHTYFSRRLDDKGVMQLYYRMPFR